MGSSTSKTQYVIGKPTPPDLPDPIEARFEDMFARAAPDNERAYTENFRKSTAEKYNPAVDANSSVTDDMLRRKIINVLRAYSQMINSIDTKISKDCGPIRGFCPRHVITENGDERELQSLDKLYPCQLRTCMKQQLRRQSAKFKRWIVNMKWAGDTAKLESEDENIPIDRRGLLEILESLQKMSLRMIEDASSTDAGADDVSTDAGASADDVSTDNKRTFRGIGTVGKNVINFITTYKSIIAIIVLVLIIVIFTVVTILQPRVANLVAEQMI